MARFHVLNVSDGVVRAGAIQQRLLRFPAAGWIRKGGRVVGIARFEADAEFVEVFYASASGGSGVSFVAVAVQRAFLVIQIERAENEFLVFVSAPQELRH